MTSLDGVAIGEALALANDVGRTPAFAVDELIVRQADGTEKRLVAVAGGFAIYGAEPDVPR